MGSDVLEGVEVISVEGVRTRFWNLVMNDIEVTKCSDVLGGENVRTIPLSLLAFRT